MKAIITVFNNFIYNEALLNVDALPSPDHYLLTGRYRFLNRQANRVVVIGKDANDNPVFGELPDYSDEIYSGERLIFKSMSMLETGADALEAAGAVQSKQRLNMVHGFISSPPNCGAELYDVVRVQDRGSPFQGGIDYRIAGIVNTYEASSGNFTQHLELCAI